MINNVTLAGRITKDLELKTVGTGTSLLNFSIAVERSYKNAQGERETDFINIVAWRGTAEFIANYFKKGDGINITGSIQTRNYENNSGQRVYVTEVIADEARFTIQNKSNNQGSQQQTNNSPFANTDFNSNDPFENNSEIEIDDSSLPF
jgi:single-strand DNA-binding protein